MSVQGDWEEYQDIDNSRIDEISGYILFALGTEGLLNTREIRQKLTEIAEDRGKDHLIVGDTQSLIYRFEEHLIPLRLAAEVEQVETDEPGKNPRRFGVTEPPGVEWLKAQDWASDKSLSAEIDSIKTQTDEYEAELIEIRDRLDSLEDSISGVSSTVGGVQTQITEYGEQVEQVREDLHETSKDLYENRRSISDIEDRIDRLETELSGLSGAADDIDDRIEDVEGRVDELETRTDDLTEWSQSAHDRLGDAVTDAESALEASAQPTTETSSNSRAITRLRYVVAAEGLALVAIVVVGCLRFAGII
jgi:DNA repair exonuclease SbcCD ATPase subunit